MDRTFNFHDLDYVRSHRRQWGLVRVLLAIYREVGFNILAEGRRCRHFGVHDRRDDFAIILLFYLERQRYGACGLEAPFVSGIPFRPCCCDRRLDLLQFVLRPQIPVGTPDTMNDPAMAFQDLLPESVAIPRRSRRMELCAVAFDAENESPRLVGVGYS